MVKPAVGAGSRGAARFDADEADVAAAAEAHLDGLHSLNLTAMVQPYLADVDAQGETALIFLGGTYSHAIRKAAMLTGEPTGAARVGALFVEESISPRVPSAIERDLADAVLAAARGSGLGEVLYARVDLLPTSAGPVVGELEMVEPSLFLTSSIGAADRFAAVIASAVAEAG